MALTPEERTLMEQVKAQGGTKQDGAEVLAEFRTRQLDIASEPEDKTGLTGVGQEIAEFGESIKFDSEPESAIGAVGQFAGNIPGDAIQLAGELTQVVGEPIETTKSIFKLGKGLLDKASEFLVEGLTDVKLNETEEEQLVDAIGGEIKKNFGTIEAFKKTVRQNPIDTLLMISGGAGSAAKVANAKGATGLASKLSKIQKVTNPANITKGVAKVAAQPLRMVGAIGKKATGLAGETLETIAKAPDEFTAAKALGSEVVRRDVSGSVFSKIQGRLDDLSETGKEFQGVRGIKEVSVTEDLLSGVQKGLDKVGIKKNPDGTLNFGDTNLDKVGQKAFEDAIGEINDVIAGKTKLSSDDLLNMRKRVDSIIPFDAPGTAKDAVKLVRGEIDKIAKSKIKGLEAIDSKFASEITELKGIRKDFFNKDGSLKDNAISKVANLTNKGNELRLQRTKDLFKGTDVDIEQAIKVLKAVEDTEALNKVGTYLQSIVIGGIATGITSNPAALLFGILTIPGVGEFLAKTVGKTDNWLDLVKAKITPEFITNNADNIKKVTDQVTAPRVEAVIQTKEATE